MLNAFDGRLPFDAATSQKIRQLRDVYDLELTADDAHRLDEKEWRTVSTQERGSR